MPGKLYLDGDFNESFCLMLVFYFEPLISGIVARCTVVLYHIQHAHMTEIKMNENNFNVFAML